ncbi:MAG TPA: protein phosphatase 2C domain-containing protein [Terriglobales bacterium]|nr:protein phosphatase 2C domain-containing protein [Terriglobales bacterium]
MDRRERITDGGRSVGGAYPALHSSMLDVEFVQLSDCGRVREQNEDYVGHVAPATEAQVRSHGWLFALADGVGGHRQGEVASRVAVETVLAGFRQATPGEPHTTLLARLVQSANTQVYETGLASGTSGAGMASTLVACALRFDRAAVAHVGDSRCYLIRSGHAKPITRDHTVANEQLRLGVLSAQEAAEVSTRHVLSRSIGADLFVNVETNEIQLLPGDVLLLCSDGLHGAVPIKELAHIVSHRLELKTAARELVASANQRDGGDNITVQLIRIRSVERMGMYRGRPYKLR